MRLLVAIALLVSGSAYAAADCYPNAYNPPEHVGLIMPQASNGDTHWVSWRCPTNPGFIYIDAGKPSDIASFLAAAAVGAISPAAADAKRATLPLMPEPEWKVLKRRILVDYYAFPPKSLTNIAYKRRVVVNGEATYVRFGTLAAPVDCAKGGKYGTYMQIDRELVKKDTVFSVMPDALFAVCG